MNTSTNTLLANKNHEDQSPRTLSQNALFWVWIKQIASVTGLSNQDLHDYYCTRYLKRYIHINGQQKIISKTTRHLTSKCFSEFLNNIQIDAFETFGIILNYHSPTEKGGNISKKTIN